METSKDSVPACILKCLRNVEDVSNDTHSLKYGVVCWFFKNIYVICVYKVPSTFVISYI